MVIKKQSVKTPLPPPVLACFGRICGNVVFATRGAGAAGVREAGAAVVVGEQAGEEKGGGAGAGPGGAGRQHGTVAAQTLCLCPPLPADGSLSSPTRLCCPARL